MYSVSISSSFNAMHQVKLPDGSLEPLHGHDWSVRVWFCAEELDAQDMVVDFVRAMEGLRSTLAPLHHTNLNESLRTDDGRLPTAEVVARHIFDALRAAGLAQTSAVEVTEAPGCTACYGTPHGPES